MKDGIHSNGTATPVYAVSARLGNFNKRVDKLIDKAGPSQALMEVTPEMATEMLMRNRPPRTSCPCA